MDDLGEELRKKVYLEAKPKSVLARDLRVSESRVEQVAAELIGQGLLEEVPGQREVTYKHRQHVQDFVDKAKKL